MLWRCGANMDEPGWLSFYAAASEIEQLFHVSEVEARRKLRQACAEEKVISMKAPLDPGRLPFEFWIPVAPRAWRQREVDYDGPGDDGCKIEVMVKEANFRCWLGKRNAPVQTRMSRKQYLVKQAIDALQLSDDLPSSEIEKRVGAFLKEKHQISVSRTTILRAFGRRRD